MLRRASGTLDRAERFFDRHGGRAVFLGRFVGALRAVVPFAAGAARMPYGRFLVWNVAASIAWVAAVVGAGWALGGTVAAVVEDVSAGLSVLVVAALVVLLVRRRRRAGQRAEALHRSPEAAGDEPLEAGLVERHLQVSADVTDVEGRAEEVGAVDEEVG